MNRAPFNYDETDPQNMNQYTATEQVNSNNAQYYHNEIQGENNALAQKPSQFVLNGETRNSNKKQHQSHPNANNQECALNRLFSFGSYLISPIEEFRGKDSAFTPLKNESLFLLSSSNKRDIQNSFEKCDFSLSKKEEGLIHGTCLNFNNIEISPEVSDNEDLYDDSNTKPNQQNEGNQMILSNINSNNNNNSNFNSINKIQCTCTKTNCKKKYCACYANGKYCDNCQCKNCDNKGMNTEQSKHNLAMSIICNCTKSNCTKKYCECFKNGIECSSLCRCINCINSSSSAVNDCNKQVINVKEYHKSQMNSIEEIRIEIRNNIISVQQRGSHYCHSVSAGKVKHANNILHSNKRKNSQSLMNETYTPMKAIGKKRVRSKAESTNNKTPGSGFLLSNKTSRSNNKKLLSNKKKLDL